MTSSSTPYAQGGLHRVDTVELPPSPRLRSEKRRVNGTSACWRASPRIIAAIVDGTAPADLTVTDLAKALSYSSAEQEQGIGCSNEISRRRTNANVASTPTCGYANRSLFNSNRSPARRNGNRKMACRD
jgi:hypothetical protein